jgi:hypothetical protein
LNKIKEFAIDYSVYLMMVGVIAGLCYLCKDSIADLKESYRLTHCTASECDNNAHKCEGTK